MEKINLQLFAEEEEEKTLMDLLEQDENIKKEFQATVDRRITQALETREKKHQEELKKQEQRAKMTAEELQAEKERDLAERENKIRQYELKLAKIEYFKDNNIPLELVDYVNVNDSDEIVDKAKALQAVIDAQVEKRIKSKLKEDGLDLGDSLSTPNVDVTDFKGMSVEEINANWDKIMG